MRGAGRACLSAATVPLLLLATVTACGAGAPKADFYVAPDGRDAFDGRLPASDGSGGGPFATLHRARDAVRRLMADGGRGLPPAAGFTGLPGRLRAD